MNEKLSDGVIRRWAPWGAGLAVFLFHLLTSGSGIDPLVSARLVADHLRLTPFPPLTNPVWGVVVRLFAALPFSLAFNLRLLAALCSGISSGLFFALMCRWPWQLPEKYRHPGRLNRASLVSAVVGVVLFATTLPTWIAGTRVVPIGLGLMLLLLCACLLLQVFTTRHPAAFLLLLFLWGVGITEYGTFIVLSPLLFVFLLVFLVQVKPYSRAVLCQGGGGFLAGLCGVYLIHALSYMQTPAYQWREFGGIHQVLWFIWRDQYHAIKAGLVAVGWLLILTLLIAPWLIMLLLPFFSQRKARFRLPSFFLLVTLAIIMVFILFNIPPAPWTFTQLHPLILLPYLLFASWTGRLAATFYLVLASADRKGKRSRVRLFALGLLSVSFVVLVGAATVRNHAVVHPAPADRMHGLAAEVVEHMRGRHLLISHGFLEQSMLIAAYERDIHLRTINPSLAISPGYRRYVASLFDHPRLRNLATINLDALMVEWSKDVDKITSSMAVVQQPDVWNRVGCSPVPLPLAYFGRPDAPDCAELLEVASYWEQHAKDWTRPVHPRNLAAGWTRIVRTTLSQINNNLGVLLEDCEHPGAAQAAYVRARELDESNLSAMMNLATLLRRAGDPEAELLEQDLDDLIAAQRRRANFWLLSSRYGYIRNPHAYIAQGHAWAISGKPAAAIREIRRAIDISEENPAMQLMLAQLYIEADDPEAGADTYRDLLARDPESPAALAGMARLAISQGHVQDAQRYFDELQALGVDPSSPAVQDLVVALAIQSEDYAATRDLLRGLIRQTTDHARLWAVLALLANEEDDERTINECARALTDAMRAEPMLAMVMAQIEIRRGNLKDARDYLSRAIRRRPSVIPLREQRLKILVNLRLRDDAEDEARAILSLEPANAVANFVMGTIQQSRGDTAFAENSFRASLETERSPHALNDLAWLLAQRGRTEEAYPLILESLELYPENPNALDTYGLVLMQLGRLEEAETSVRRALAYYPEHPVMQLHLAQIYERRGLIEQATQIARPLMDRMHEIPRETYDAARDIVMRARRETHPETGELIPPER